MAEFLLMRIDLHESPKVARVAASLECSIAEAVGHLHRAWGWARRHSDATGFADVPAGHLNTICGVDGLSDAMAAVGWLVEERGGVVFPEVDRWISRKAEGRAKAAQRQRDKRSRDVTTVSQNECDETRTREEERRGEKNSAPTTTSYHPRFVGEGEEKAFEAAVAAAQELSHRLEMTRGNVTSAANRIAESALQNPCVGHEPAEVIRRAFLHVASRPTPPGRQVSHWRNAVLQVIRDAHENGELPGEWVERTRPTAADALGDKLRAVREAGGAA